MRIEYQQFADSVLVFAPSRDEQEMLLDILKFLRREYEEPKNLAVLEHFIERIEYELSSSTN